MVSCLVLPLAYREEISTVTLNSSVLLVYAVMFSRYIILLVAKQCMLILCLLLTHCFVVQTNLTNVRFFVFTFTIGDYH